MELCRGCLTVIHIHVCESSGTHKEENDDETTYKNRRFDEIFEYRSNPISCSVAVPWQNLGSPFCYLRIASTLGIH